MKKLAIILCLIQGLINGQELVACDACQCRVPGRVGKFTLSLNYRYSNLNNLYGSAESPAVFGKLLHGGNGLERGSFERYTTVTLVGGYRFFPRWTLNVMVPFTKRSSRELTAMDDDRSSTFGFGDASVIMGYDVIYSSKPDFDYHVALQAGVKLPTGQASQRSSENLLIDPHIQSGSGSVDYVLGADASQKLHNLELLADFVYRRNTEGAHAYRFGDFINYRAGFAYTLWRSLKQANFLDTPKGVIMSAGLNMDGEWEGTESHHGNRVESTGGHTIFASPKVNLIWSQFTVSASYQIPVYHRLNGTQLGQSGKWVTEIRVAL